MKKLFALLLLSLSAILLVGCTKPVVEVNIEEPLPVIEEPIVEYEEIIPEEVVVEEMPIEEEAVEEPTPEETAVIE
ncbi:hypothetical protein EOM09_08525 [bacterium]|nr:hypothetical protein [bacterium]